MFPTPDLQFKTINAFIDSLSPDQRAFYLALESDREVRLQSALVSGSQSLSAVSALLSDSIQIRFGSS